MFSGRHFRSRQIGLALSGGSVRGIAHIGVIKVLSEYGIRPAIVVGTSAGSLIGAGIAAGMNWRELKKMAESVFWPSLLNGAKLEQFCSRHLPSSFAELSLPFAAIATTLPRKRTVILTTGRLVPAISASCSVRLVRRPVRLNGERLKDGGISCVLPVCECRQLGADFIIGSDVWEYGAFFRGMGVSHGHSHARRIYPRHYLQATHSADVLIQPDIPIKVYVPGAVSVEQLVAAGEAATRRALNP
ncbi:MAG TPA: patatin-like phospholipase family protein [Candidatus Angelobacter sp.]